MLHTRFRFSMTITDRDGALLLREDLHDLMPCYEDLLFTGVTGGCVANDGSMPPATLEPVWDRGDACRVAGFTASLGSLTKRYELAVVADRVHVALAGRDGLVEERAQTSSGVRWWIEAVEGDGSDGPRRLRTRVSRRPYPLVDAPLAAFGIRARPEESHPIAILLRRDLVEEMRAETAASLDLERADILTGHLVRDPDGLVAVVVTGRIPADTATAASRSHFEFSPLTFVAAREKATRTPDGGHIVGWHHNHPPRCGRDCLALVPSCQTSMLFFSTPQDRAVHRASFSNAYMIGLVTGKEAGRRADEPGLRAYGWRDGAIVERRYTVF